MSAVTQLKYLRNCQMNGSFFKNWTISRFSGNFPKKFPYPTFVAVPKFSGFLFELKVTWESFNVFTQLFTATWVEIFLVASWYRNRVKFRPDGPFGSYADFTLPYLTDK